jgi:hypothetical protein
MNNIKFREVREIEDRFPRSSQRSSLIQRSSSSPLPAIPEEPENEMIVSNLKKISHLHALAFQMKIDIPLDELLSLSELQVYSQIISKISS